MKELSFEEFQEYFVTSFTKQLFLRCPQYKDDYEITTVTVNKQNQTFTGISIHRKDGSPSLCPTVYIEKAYQACYEDNVPLSIVIRNYCDVFVEAMENASTIIPETADSLINRIKVGDYQIIGNIANTILSDNLLKECPHRIIAGDMALYYRAVINKTEKGLYSITINNELAEYLNVSEAQLYESAESYYSLDFKTAIVKPIEEYIAEMVGVPSEAIPELPTKMLIITSSDKVNGAAAIISKEVKEEVARQIRSDDFILIPSSMHECIAIPYTTDKFKLQFLMQMQKDIQFENVEPNDVISDDVFWVNAKTNEISLIKTDRQPPIR